MANRKIQVDILADASRFMKGTGQAAQSTSTLQKALQKLGPVGQGIQSVIDKLGFASVSSAVGIASVPAAVLAGAAIINKAVDSYVDLGAKVRDYSIVTGQSAEASSRQVQAFAELGVGEDTAAASMVKLSKAVETTPGKLQALGIEVARDAKGNVDVAAAWQGTTDAAKRNEIALTAFGKGGAAMIPVLEANAAQLARLEAQVQLVYSAQDLQQVRDYQVAQKELDNSWQQLTDTIGRDFLPVKKAVIDDANENIYVWNHLDEQLAKMGATHSQSRAAIMEASQALRDEYRASLDAQHQADELAASQKAAADAAQQEADAESALYDSLQKAGDADAALTDASFALRDAQNRVRDAMAAYTQAVKEHGAGSQQARDALLALQEAQQAEAEDARRVALAAVAQAEAQAEANGTTLSAADKADIYRKKLQDLASQLGPNDPLRKELQAYIDELKSIPGDVNTTIGYHTVRTVDDSGNTKTRGGTKAYAEGGFAGETPGDPVPAILHRNEAVLNPSQQRDLVATAASLGSTAAQPSVGDLAPAGAADMYLGAAPPIPAGGVADIVAAIQALGAVFAEAPAGRDIQVDVHIGSYVGDARELSKILARELRISGAFTR
jgi:hypothetical protein